MAFEMDVIGAQKLFSEDGLWGRFPEWAGGGSQNGQGAPAGLPEKEGGGVHAARI